MCGNDLVDTMWLTTWVVLRAIDFIAKSGSGYAVDSMQ
jgi:hypothetical protein